MAEEMVVTPEDGQNPAATAAPAVDTAPLSDVTATPDDSANADSKPEDEQKPPKTFTQEELDEIVQKRLAKERRKLERQLQRPDPAPQAPVQANDGEPVKPKISEFQTVEEYDAAMEQWADKKAEFKERVKEKQQAELRQREAQHEILAAHEDREDSAREKYPDYDTVVGNPNLPITAAMADAIRLSDVGPDVAFYLGQNVKEAARIAQLPPILQVKEIGRLEAKVQLAPPVSAKKPSSAPDPITPIKAGGTATYTNLNDPRALKQLGTSGLIAAWNAEAARQRQR